MSRPAAGTPAHKRRLMFGAIALLALVLLVAASIRIYQINAEHPSPTLVERQQGETIRGGNFELTVTQTRLLSHEELLELAPTYEIDLLDEHGEKVDGSKIRMLAVDVNITNISTDEQELRLYQFSARSKAWRNDVDMFTFLDLNDTGSLVLSLPGGESTHVILPYFMGEVQFKNAEDWARAKERPYDLVLATYPVLEVVHLKLSE